jgi:hypothetical protein
VRVPVWPFSPRPSMFQRLENRPLENSLRKDGLMFSPMDDRRRLHDDDPYKFEELQWGTLDQRVSDGGFGTVLKLS